MHHHLWILLPQINLTPSILTNEPHEIRWGKLGDDRLYVILHGVVNHHAAFFPKSKLERPLVLKTKAYGEV